MMVGSYKRGKCPSMGPCACTGACFIQEDGKSIADKIVIYPSPEEQEKSFWLKFGNNLAKARKDVGFTQEDVAFYMGVSRATIANIETGRQVVTVYDSERYATLFLLGGNP